MACCTCVLMVASAAVKFVSAVPYSTPAATVAAAAGRDHRSRPRRAAEVAPGLVVSPRNGGFSLQVELDWREVVELAVAVDELQDVRPQRRARLVDVTRSHRRGQEEDGEREGESSHVLATESNRL